MGSIAESAWVVKADRVSVGIVSIASLVGAAAILLGFVLTTIGRLTSGEISFPVILQAPVPAGQFGAGRGITSAFFTASTVTANGLSTGPFAFFIAADAVNALTGLTVTLALAFMGWRLLRGDPFRKSVIYSSLVAACALVLGPFLALLLSTTATTRALLEIMGPSKGGPELILSAHFELAPFLAGVGLAIVLGAFEFGQKLSADTAGLV